MTDWVAVLRWRPPARALLLGAGGLWDLSTRARHADFGAWCQAHPGQRAVLWLGAAWLSDVVCDPGAPLQEAAARSEWARRVLQHYHGDAAGAWPMLPWRLRSALGAGVLHGIALPALRQQAQAHRVTLLAVRPLWPLLLDRLLALRPAWRRAESAQAWIIETAPGPSAPAGQAAQGEPAHQANQANQAGQGMLTLITLDRGLVRAVSRRRLPAPWPTFLEARLAADVSAPHPPSAAVLLGLDAATPLPLDVALSLPAPFTSLAPGLTGHGPDFLHPQARPAARAWVCLGVALLALTLAAGHAAQAWQARQQALSLAVPAAPRVRAVAAAPQPVDAALQRRLSHPWREVFLASEAPGAVGLTWLTLEHRVGSELRLQGVATEPAPVQRAAAALRARPAWRLVLVSRLETQPEGQAFEIVARLAGDAR